MKNLYVRILPFLLFSSSFTILFIAYSLEADHSGIGTHQQLGLEPCGFLTRVKIPCMMCGMTTSFSLYMHARILDGIANQPFSALLFLGTLYTCFLSLLDLVEPRARVSRFLDVLQNLSRTWYIVILLLFLSSWIFKILIHRA